MRLLVFYIIIFLLISYFAESQEQELDSLWNLEELNPEDFDFSPDFAITFSKGWFPRPLKTTMGIGIFYSGGSLYDVANRLRSISFIPTYNGFQGDYGFKKDQEKIKKKNSKDDEDDFPEASIWDLGISTIFSSKYLLLEGKAYYSRSHGILSSIDDTRSFLNLAGKKQKFLEGAVVHLAEHNIGLSVNTIIPIWGAFVFEQNSMSSYYYLKAGITWEFPIASEATQYFQILDVKDDLRYRSGADTVRVMFEEKLKTINSGRKRFEIGVGTILDVHVLVFDMHLSYSYMLDAVLKDAVWKQHHLKLTLAAYYNFIR